MLHRNVQSLHVDDRNLKICYGRLYMLPFDYLKNRSYFITSLHTRLLGLFSVEHCALPVATQGEIHLFDWNGLLRCSGLCSAVLATATEEDAGGRERGSCAGGGEEAVQHILYLHLTIPQQN